jgi:hypothetical protein
VPEILCGSHTAGTSARQARRDAPPGREKEMARPTRGINDRYAQELRTRINSFRFHMIENRV